MEYIVEYDTFHLGYDHDWFIDEDLHEVLVQVEETLKSNGGGHADIYDEYDNFVTDMEV